MHNILAPTSALSQEQVFDHRHPGPLVPVDQMLAAALLELDLEAAQRQSRRVGPLTNITAHRKELAATKRVNRSTLNEIAASLGVSRSTLNRILEEPPPRAWERDVEVTEGGGGGKRHKHGAGRRRHTGAGGRRHTGVGVILRRGRVRTA
jgi:hypothetical protein